jgi:hypothetical protein
VNKVRKPPVLEFWLTRTQWVQFTRVMESCHRAAGGPVGPAECLELLCRYFLAQPEPGRSRAAK